MVANVNGVVLTRGQVEGTVNALMGRFGGQIPPEQLAGLKQIFWKQALESLINQQLLIQEANKEGVQPDAGKVDAQIKEIAGRLPGGESLDKRLAAMGITEAQLRQNISQDLKIEALLDKNVPPGEKPTDKEVKEFYQEHPEQFKTPERVQASHILIKFTPGESEESKAQKKLKMEELRKKIKKGEDFAKLASENSECPSKSKGGDLGFFERGKMVKPFEDAAFGMKVGQLSDVVETKFGYHLIKVTGHEKESVTSFKEAKDKLAESMVRQKRQEGVAEYLKKLRGSAKIEYAGNSKP
jgi:peptidyl-prolyl cis-trans isomerase C